MKKRVCSLLTALILVFGSAFLPMTRASELEDGTEEYLQEESYDFADELEPLPETESDSGEDLLDDGGPLPDDAETAEGDDLYEEQSEEGLEEPEEESVDDPDLVDMIPVGEEDELTAGEEDEEEQTDGYVFAGYLPDGTPDFVWVGEEPEPEILADLDELLAEDGGELLYSTLFTANAVSVGAADTVNYYISAPKYPTYHSYAKMSSSKNTSIKDGIHKDSQGRARAYKGGKYFIDGSFALNGKPYYADEDGYLLSGWARMRRPSVEKERGHVAYHFYYFDPSDFSRSKGYRTIDGIPHYFDDAAGYMYYNAGVEIDGKLYYVDRYGVCDRPKLVYGNVVQTDAENGPDPANSAYLAVNNTTAVDIATFTGQDGEYSFRPRMLANTTIEPFGFTPISLPDGYYCKLYDGSLKGKIGCTYRNVGRYKGREVDMRLTVTDYTFFEFDGYQEMGYFYVKTNKIGINATNLVDITANMQFYDHETQKPLTLKGFATLSDIDISQCITILSDVTDVYVDKSSHLYRNPGTLSFTAPFSVTKNGNATTDDDMEYAVQVNYNSDHLTFRFGAAYHDYVYAGCGLPINGESRAVWAYDYTGNDNDYAIIDSQGTLWQSWQGLHYQRFGRVSLPPVTKTVSDADETDVTDNHLKDRKEAFTYSLHHVVPGEIEQFYYSAYQITDDLSPDLKIDESSLKVLDDGGNDVSGWFTANISGQKITFQAKPSVLGDESFYDRGYNFRIGVSIRPERNLGSGSEYTVENSCRVSIDRSTGPEQQESNKVVTHVPLAIPLGEIRITKRIRSDEIVWAHGNPTFLFRVEGKDLAGKAHSYETYLCFSKGNAGPDGNGYAVLNTLIRNVPLGTYDVKELRVMDYYLTGASADTANMTIHTVGSPGRDKDPSQTCYGTAVLDDRNRTAGITFTDQKGDYHGYRHTDVVMNTIPLTFS